MFVMMSDSQTFSFDAGALCLKAGNAVILRGGSESFHSSGAIHACLVEGLRAAGLPEDASLEEVFLHTVGVEEPDEAGQLEWLTGVRRDVV